jgi:Ca2+-binding RTX toxin-like protein
MIKGLKDLPSISPGGVTVDLQAGTSTGEGSDTLSGFERGVIFGDSAVQTLTVSSFTGSVDVYTGGGSDTVNGNGAKTFVGADDSGAIDVTDALIDGPTYNVTLNNVGAVQVGGSDLADHIDARTFHGPVTLLGQDGNDTLLGGPKADEINGLDGNDVVRGYRGNDIVRGGLGKDAIDGGKGTDACDGTKSDKSVQNCEKKAPPIKK